jgi:archaellum component FlaC
MDNDELTTKPTIETVLERINSVGDQVQAFQNRVESELAGLRKENAALRESVERVEKAMEALRMDDMEKQMARTRMDIVNLKNDFRDLRGQIKERISA